ncbi:MAG: DNA-3-methyladenine glycosylase, partial [Frankiales bacterium]|nr:DNA-3-methyladenine glycosylase [Frankiales bacterium]
LQDMRDLSAAIARCRRLLDLDADPVAVDALLSEDALLEPLVRKAPGRRVPRTVDGDELAIRAVIGQQVSTGAARTHAGRLVLALGDPVDDATLTHLFPTPEALAEAGDHLAMPAARRETVLRLARALAEGDVDLDPGVDRDRARAQLSALKGIGPWTVETIAMRALGDPDAFLPTDLGVVQLAEGLGLKGRALLEHAEQWRPWRAYAVQHLWALGDHPVNSLPGGSP